MAFLANAQFSQHLGALLAQDTDREIEELKEDKVLLVVDPTHGHVV